MTGAARPRLGAIHLVLESVRLLLPHFLRLFPLAFLPALFLAALGRVLEDPAAEGHHGWSIAIILTWTLLSGIAIAMLCLAAFDALHGRRGSAAGYLAVALQRIVALTLLGFVFFAMVAAGMLLFVIPGLYLLGRFQPWLAALLYEDARWTSLARAQDLTEGYRWPLAGATLFFLIIAALVPLPAMVLSESFGGLPGFLLEATGLAIGYMLNGLFVALIYLRLRDLEGLAADAGESSVPS